MMKKKCVNTIKFKFKGNDAPGKKFAFNNTKTMKYNSKIMPEI